MTRSTSTPDLASSAKPAGDPAIGPAPIGWSRDELEACYGLDRWGLGYFGVNELGHLTVHRPPQADSAAAPAALDLKQLVDSLRGRGIDPPVLLRFSDILRDRIDALAQAFANAQRDLDYHAGYRCVYPIKVNQQRHVVEQVLAFGRAHGFGLEAGSKPELMAALALVDDEETPIICNGFKDQPFIEAVMLANKCGRWVIPVIEKPSELPLMIEAATRLGVRPSLGIRVKLASMGGGKWEASGGEHSKFGLMINQVIDAVELLREADMLDSLRLVHAHVGSQVNDIRGIKRCVAELARVYTELVRAGAAMGMVDVGGGLGVDYDGTHSQRPGSMNYTLQEYANDVVHHLAEVCRDAGVPEPIIFSESGRALSAYHSVLVMSVIGTNGPTQGAAPPTTGLDLDALPPPVRQVIEAERELAGGRDPRECYHDAQVARQQATELFSLGYCSLEHLGLVQRVYAQVAKQTLEALADLEHPPPELAKLTRAMADTYYCNGSVFQSLPDAWAIEQVFPVMPIHRLHELPTRRGILVDITCDSDGKLDRFIHPGPGQPFKQVLELHELQGDEPYDLAVFLVGAYQETLGDLHNLFGDTHAVHVSMDDEGQPVIEEVVEGDTVAEVLSYVQFHPDQLRHRFQTTVEQAVRAGRLTSSEAGVLRRFYQDGLAGYTYLA